VNIAAVAKIVGDYPNLRYRIAGDGPLKPDLERQIKALGLEERVCLLGWQDQDVVIRLMDEAHLLLAPSVTAADGDQEGTPTVLIEALARGLPVLSTRHSAIPEVVQEGISGYLVEERDVSDLATKLRKLIKECERWPDMGRAGHDHIRSQFDIDKLCADLTKIYQGV
jgi:colanic acid/amylovoran biosynthesis glycosyltransferase